MGKNPAEKAKMKQNVETAEGKKPAKEGTVVTSAAAQPEKRKKHHATTQKRGERKCKMKACKRSYKAKGYCVTHYKEWRNGKFGRARFKTCKDSNCFKPITLNRHGYCEEHFQNYYVKGVKAVKAAPATAPKVEEKKAAVA